MKLIAIFGGSFDPPHLAHFAVIKHLIGLKDFDEVWVVPTYAHPFAKDMTAYSHRCEMVGRMIKGEPRSVKMCTLEGELKKTPSFMIDTIRALKKRFPTNRFRIVMGSDCKVQLDQWKDSEALKEEAGFFFIPRPGYEDSPYLDISSSEIRQGIKEGKDMSKYLADTIRHYIEENQLYR